jgi:hypothetical protein
VSVLDSSPSRDLPLPADGLGLHIDWKLLPIGVDLGAVTDIRVERRDTDWSVVLCGPNGAARFDHELRPQPTPFELGGQGNTYAPTRVVDVDADGVPEYLQGGDGCKEVRLFSASGSLLWRIKLPFSTWGFGGIGWIVPVRSERVLGGAFGVLCVGVNDDFALLLDQAGVIREKIAWDSVNCTDLAIDAPSTGVRGDDAVVYGSRADLVARRCDGRLLWRVTTPNHERFVNIVRYSRLLSEQTGHASYYVSSATGKGSRSKSYWCVFRDVPEWEDTGEGAAIQPIVYNSRAVIMRNGEEVFLRVCDVASSYRRGEAAPAPPIVAGFDRSGRFIGSSDPSRLSERPKPADLVPDAKIAAFESGGTYRVVVGDGGRAWLGVVDSAGVP